MLPCRFFLSEPLHQWSVPWTYRCRESDLRNKKWKLHLFWGTPLYSMSTKCYRMHFRKLINVVVVIFTIFKRENVWNLIDVYKIWLICFVENCKLTPLNQQYVWLFRLGELNFIDNGKGNWNWHNFFIVRLMVLIKQWFFLPQKKKERN